MHDCRLGQKRRVQGSGLSSRVYREHAIPEVCAGRKTDARLRAVGEQPGRAKINSQHFCSISNSRRNIEDVKLFRLNERTPKEIRCPYCVVDKKFLAMTVLPNGRLICKNCGHTVFPNDTAFRCPCPKCLAVNLSPRMRRLRKP